MGICPRPDIENPIMVNFVNPHLSRSVDYIPRSNHNPNMYDFTHWIVEKGEVAGLGFIYKINSNSFYCLLCSIAGQIQPTHLVNNLHKPRTINPEHTPASPQIRYI